MKDEMVSIPSCSEWTSCLLSKVLTLQRWRYSFFPWNDWLSLKELCCHSCPQNMLLSRWLPVKYAILWVSTSIIAQARAVQNRNHSNIRQNACQWCFMMSCDCVACNEWLLKPVVFSIKWNGYYSAFSAQNSIKNMSGHSLTPSQLPSYFENPCHECPI